MRSNIGRVVALLGNEAIRQQRPTVHQDTLKMVAHVEDASFRHPVMMLLSYYDNDKHKPDSYWTIIFQAHLLAQYADAHRIADLYVNMIIKDMFTFNISRIYLPFMTALLEVGTWKAEEGNAQLQEALPHLLAELVLNCNQYEYRGIFEQYPVLPVAWEKFSTAFRQYFDPANMDFRFRMSTFCTELHNILQTVSGPPVLMRRFAAEMLGLMPRYSGFEQAVKWWSTMPKVG